MTKASATWAARMIAPEADKGRESTAFVSQQFDCADPAGAVLRITAMGLYRAFVNGERVGHDLLTPGWTVYDARHPYQTYDIAGLLRPGANRIDIWLADGWWRGQLMWAAAPIFDCWGSHIAALAQIDGPKGMLVATDETWRSGPLPIIRSGIYLGEEFDARIAPAPTHGTKAVAFDMGLLVPHEIAPVQELAALAPVDQWTDAEGRVTYDFGQNCAALIRFDVTGSAGSAVSVDHSEVMGPDRAWDNRNYRSAEARAQYVLTDGAQTYQPMFTFMGFRYARLTLSGDARITAIHAVPITSVPEQTGHFTCGHPLVNRLVENTVWSQRSNFIEVPTDCPQRDERLGWTGDAQVFSGTACWLADSHDFLRKFLRDVMADQREDGAVPHFSPDPTRLHQVQGRGVWAGSTGWGDAIVIIPWQLYLHYGDKGVLAECLPAMVRWLDYLWSISDGPVIYPHAHWGDKGFTFGDWLQPVGDNRKPRPTIGDDCAATLYHFISTDLTARIAAILGYDDLAKRMADRAGAIRAAFADEFITPSGRLAHNDQTSYALAFLHGLVPPEHADAARAHFRRIIEDADGKIGTGFIGTPDLLPALSREGLHDLAGKVFLNEKVPGWLYQVKMGATTIWERWDALGEDGTIYDPEMNSYNHYAYGAVCQWLFEGVAGLRRDPDHPGFAGMILDPVIIAEMSPVAARHDSPKGQIAAQWRIEGGTVHYDVTLPQGCTAQFIARGRSDLIVDGVAAHTDVALGSGQHEITFAVT